MTSLSDVNKQLTEFVFFLRTPPLIPNILVPEAIKSEAPPPHLIPAQQPQHLQPQNDLGLANDYEFRMTHQGYQGLSSAAAAMVYRQMYMQRSAAAAAQVTSRPSSTASDYRDLHNSSPSSSVYQLPHGSWPQSWPPPPPGSTTSEVMNEDDSSVSPPHFSSPVKQPVIKSEANDHKRSSATPKKRGAASTASGGKSKKAQKDVDTNGGTKRVYSCPHCQRSYDWNYNLNRHLKYECGKENAFQCAKCGRKFPHKQNCVYHLKRKHKIVCDTIDQYMSNGLVIFRGSNNPGGQQVANPHAP